MADDSPVGPVNSHVCSFFVLICYRIDMHYNAGWIGRMCIYRICAAELQRLDEPHVYAIPYIDFMNITGKQVLIVTRKCIHRRFGMQSIDLHGRNRRVMAEQRNCGSGYRCHNRILRTEGYHRDSQTDNHRDKSIHTSKVINRRSNHKKDNRISSTKFKKICFSGNYAYLCTRIFKQITNYSIQSLYDSGQQSRPTVWQTRFIPGC